MTAANSDIIELRHGTLATLMPMYLILDAEGFIENAGPTLVRVGGQGLIGRCFFDVFEIRRPQGVKSLTDLKAASGGPLHLKTTDAEPTLFRAVCVGLSGDGRKLLMNLSFGIHVSDAVAHHNLTISDFAATDLTVELLYLLEAKSAAMAESRNLNDRLETARLIAEESSVTDPLTGLPNRRGFEKYLAQRVEQDVPIALIAIDLDYFKQVNDTYGHAAGDTVLIEAARRFRQLLRKDDVIARMGGDEFLVIVEDKERTGDLVALGQRMVDAFQKPIEFEGHACKISASIGIARQFDRKNFKIDALLRCADDALYASKRGGRSRVRLASGNDDVTEILAS